MNWLHWTAGPKTAPIRAFLFPYAGSGVSAFSGWADSLQPHLDACVVVPPGREIRYRETPLANIRLLVEGAVQAMLPYLDRPCVLFGHSFGALVAFEVARELRRVAQTPEAVFVSAAPAPQLPWPHRDLHTLGEAAFVRELGALYEPIPQVILDDPELKKIVLPALRADITVVETYVYMAEHPLQCRLTAFGGSDDLAIRPDHIRAWSQQTSAGFRFQEICGSHFYLRSARAELTRFILEELKQLRPSSVH